MTAPERSVKAHPWGQFCLLDESSDKSTSGPPLVVIPPWLTHLDALTALSGYRTFHDLLGRHHGRCQAG